MNLFHPEIVFFRRTTLAVVYDDDEYIKYAPFDKIPP